MDLVRAKNTLRTAYSVSNFSCLLHAIHLARGRKVRSATPVKLSKCSSKGVKIKVMTWEQNKSELRISDEQVKKEVGVNYSMVINILQSIFRIDYFHSLLLCLGCIHINSLDSKVPPRSPTPNQTSPKHHPWLSLTCGLKLTIPRPWASIAGLGNCETIFKSSLATATGNDGEVGHWGDWWYEMFFFDESIHSIIRIQCLVTHRSAFCTSDIWPNSMDPSSNLSCSVSKNWSWETCFHTLPSKRNLQRRRETSSF